MMDFLKQVKKQEVEIDYNPVLRWNFDNMVVRRRLDGSIQPDKEKATERIDGAVAVFMAWNRMLFSQSAQPSVYEKRGVLEF
jgi:phage terminase large subunit-like protein